jgi:WD40 repeat protein
MTFAGHTSSVRVARWSGDGRRVLTASTCQDQPVWEDPLGAYGDQTIQVWDAGSGALVGRIDNPFSDVLMQAAISPDGRSVALGAVHGEAAWWQPDSAEPTRWSGPPSTSRSVPSNSIPKDATP